MRRTPKQPDFQKFYFNYVAKGEGCGCAERIIDMAEFDRRAVTPRPARVSMKIRLRRLIRALTR